MGDLMNRLVRERAGTAAALQLKLDFVPGFDLLPGFGLYLNLPLHPRGVVAAGLPFSLLGRDTLRCLVRPCLQFIEPRCLVDLPGFVLRTPPRLRPGRGRRAQIRDAL